MTEKASVIILEQVISLNFAQCPFISEDTDSQLRKILKSTFLGLP